MAEMKNVINRQSPAKCFSNVLRGYLSGGISFCLFHLHRVWRCTKKVNLCHISQNFEK